jgi:hypothetical protein
MPRRTDRSSPLLLLSVALNLVALFCIHALLKDRREREQELNRVEQTVHTLYRVLPEGFYTRDELAFAVSLPGAIPEVRDCLVQFEDDVFVFDRTNTIIGLYPKGANPFVPSWSDDPNLKCDRRLLDEQSQRRLSGVSDWNERMAGARRLLATRLQSSDPAWDMRRAGDPSAPASHAP